MNHGWSCGKGCHVLALWVRVLSLSVIAVSGLALGCSAAAQDPKNAKQVKAAPAAEASPVKKEAETPTRYREGDWVLYRFSGAFSEQPVQLCERILKQDGIKLEIEVTATRGSARRQWIQAVTDTPANQQNNALDAVYLVEEGKRRQVPIKQVYQLYEWIIVKLEGKPSELKSSEGPVQFGGEEFTCTLKTGQRAWRGEPARFSFSFCKEFLWTKGPGRVWSTKTDRTIYLGEVLGFGNKTEAAITETGCPAL